MGGKVFQITSQGVRWGMVVLWGSHLRRASIGLQSSPYDGGRFSGIGCGGQVSTRYRHHLCENFRCRCGPCHSGSVTGDDSRGRTSRTRCRFPSKLFGGGSNSRDRQGGPSRVTTYQSGRFYQAYYGAKGCQGTGRSSRGMGGVTSHLPPDTWGVGSRVGRRVNGEGQGVSGQSER